MPSVRTIEVQVTVVLLDLVMQSQVEVLRKLFEVHILRSLAIHQRSARFCYFHWPKKRPWKTFGRGARINVWFEECDFLWVLKKGFSYALLTAVDLKTIECAKEVPQIWKFPNRLLSVSFRQSLHSALHRVQTSYE